MASKFQSSLEDKGRCPATYSVKTHFSLIPLGFLRFLIRHSTYPHLVSRLAYRFDCILDIIVFVHRLISETSDTFDKHPAYLMTSVKNKTTVFCTFHLRMWKSIICKKATFLFLPFIHIISFRVRKRSNTSGKHTFFAFVAGICVKVGDSFKYTSHLKSTSTSVRGQTSSQIRVVRTEF